MIRILKIATLICLIISLIVIGGCSPQDNDNIFPKLLSNEKGDFNIWVFNEKDIKFNDSVALVAENNREKIGSIHFIYNPNGTQDTPNYSLYLKIQEYPMIILFDDKGEVFRTTHIKELEDFIAKGL